MPIIFNEDTNRFEGANLFDQVLAGFDFSVFGGLITNNGAILGAVTANTGAGIEMSNTIGASLSKVAGSPYAVDLLGGGGRNFFNDGSIFGQVRFGTGWDQLNNSGLITGQISTGAGKDFLVNHIIPGIDGGFTVGTITGLVNMGADDDTVQNTGIMGDIRLGGGNDTYSARNTDEAGPSGKAGHVIGGSGTDQFFGGDEKEKFFGGAETDFMYGGGGNDQLFGQGGNDLMFGDAGNDKMFGGAGNDTMNGGDNNDMINGGADNDLIFAGRGNDMVGGGKGRDSIFGEAGNDRLFGNDGDDTITGGEGRDTITGGEGADVFIFAARSGRDTITDLGVEDRIDLMISFDSTMLFADIEANTEFTGGDAIVNLSALYNEFGGSEVIDHGSVLTLNGVAEEDFSAEMFGLSDFILVAT